MNTIVLACGHRLLFRSAPPLRAEELWCNRCQAMSTAVNAPPEWRIRCRNCPYSHMCGASRDDAEKRAQKHYRARGHKVAVYDGRKLVYVLGQTGGTVDTPFPRLYVPTEPPKEPPF